MLKEREQERKVAYLRLGGKVRAWVGGAAGKTRTKLIGCKMELKMEGKNEWWSKVELNMQENGRKMREKGKITGTEYMEMS